MSDMSDDNLADYYRQAESWAQDREASRTKSARLAWIAAGVLGAIALFEAIALVVLLPLKTVIPYTLLVDRQTGYVQAIKPLERETITPDRALVRSFLAQYIMAREGFDIDSLRDTYDRVALWSTGDARRAYIDGMQASNPASPLASLPRRAIVQVQVRSIVSLNNDTAMVRYATVRTDPGGQPQAPQPWAAVIRYRFSGEAMTAADRLINPLGFQVLRYRRDAEMIPDPAPMAAPVALAPQNVPSVAGRTGSNPPVATSPAGAVSARVP